MRILLLSSLCLVSCSPSAGEQAEKRYFMVQTSTHTDQELCDVAREAEVAWLTNGNQAKYQEWKQRRDADCLNADLARRLG